MLRYSGCTSEMKINPNLFCVSLSLINFLTLSNENIFSFPSLNRNFALPLQHEIRARASLLEASRLEVSGTMGEGSADSREASFDFTEE